MAHMAKQAMQEREIEVNRVRLIETLTENREKHIKAYREALAGDKAAAAAKLKEDAQAARDQLEKNVNRVAIEIETFDPERPNRFADTTVLIQQFIMTLPVPRCYASAYDAAIDIAKWDVNDTITLAYSEFNCFVRDQWEWTEDFSVTNARYTR